jgi:two-component system, OmpR family, response regulator
MLADQLLCRVLVVDDNRDAADSLALVLKIWGHDVWVAYDGAAAMVDALAGHPDVVLLDFTLPDVDGFDLLAALRRQLPGLAAISISARNDVDFLSQLADAGINEHLPKPLNLIALKAFLKEPARLRNRTLPPPWQPPSSVPPGLQVLAHA